MKLRVFAGRSHSRFERPQIQPRGKRAASTTDGIL